jgi:hypothetical protein
MKRLVLVLVASLHHAALASEPPRESITELDEVVVDGRKPLRDPQKFLDWLQRLPGSYGVSGTLLLHGQEGVNNLLKVQGESRCISYASTPAVHCELTLPWRAAREAVGEAAVGGIANLDSMLMLLAYEHDRISLRHMTVDSKGNAEAGLGYLLSADEFASRNKCMSIRGDCERVLRITAAADQQEVEMEIEILVDHKVVSKLHLVMHRAMENVPNPSSGAAR